MQKHHLEKCGGKGKSSDRLEFVLSYPILFRIPVQLLYSHLNPLLYLLVLKKFQQHRMKFLMKPFHLLLSTKRDASIQSSYLQQTISHLGGIVSYIFKSSIACLLFLSLVFLQSACFNYGVGATQNVLHVQRVAIETTNRLNTERSFFLSSSSLQSETIVLTTEESLT